MKKLLISACLIGENCKYNGGNNLVDNFDYFKNHYELIPICPEILGGLPTPRLPSEIIDGQAINKAGENVTKEFRYGAQKALEIAKLNECDLCLLKERSPSCGVNLIYDGSFSGKVINGMGITAKLLKEQGFTVFSEMETEKLM